MGQAELIRRIKEAIAERPEQERALLTRHYVDDVTMLVMRASREQDSRAGRRDRQRASSRRAPG